jgi:hypothetical protein
MQLLWSVLRKDRITTPRCDWSLAVFYWANPAGGTKVPASINPKILLLFLP